LVPRADPTLEPPEDLLGGVPKPLDADNDTDAEGTVAPDASKANAGSIAFLVAVSRIVTMKRGASLEFNYETDCSRPWADLQHPPGSSSARQPGQHISDPILCRERRASVFSLSRAPAFVVRQRAGAGAAIAGFFAGIYPCGRRCYDP